VQKDIGNEQRMRAEVIVQTRDRAIVVCLLSGNSHMMAEKKDHRLHAFSLRADDVQR
jgi:hypothetical protein